MEPRSTRNAFPIGSIRLVDAAQNKGALRFAEGPVMSGIISYTPAVQTFRFDARYNTLYAGYWGRVESRKRRGWN